MQKRKKKTKRRRKVDVDRDDRDNDDDEKGRWRTGGGGGRGVSGGGGKNLSGSVQSTHHLITDRVVEPRITDNYEDWFSDGASNHVISLSSEGVGTVFGAFFFLSFRSKRTSITSERGRWVNVDAFFVGFFFFFFFWFGW